MQQLKLKRLKLKKEIPTDEHLKYVDFFWLNFQLIRLYKHKKTERVYFVNTMNNKWYELVNERLDD